jgi:serine/threonine protein kinase/TPR repeat protein
MAEKTTFDHYEVLLRDDGSPWELGRGAMGITYKAVDVNLHTEVALKVINSATLANESARLNFVREARAAAQLRNRHVASVFHLGVDGESCFYAMEFIDGETIDALVKRTGPLPPLLAFRIALQITRALAAAERHKLVHRDIKPSNVMLLQEEEELVAKVIDFGLAVSTRPADQDDASTRAPGFFGTPHFASPEQLEESDLDLRSDIYSLGMTLWFMLTGRAAFQGPIAQVMSAQLHQAPPYHQLPPLPDAALRTVRRMLEKDRAKRPQTPAELRQELEESLAELGGQGEPAVQEEIAAPILERDVTPQFQRQAAGTVLAERYEVIEDCGEGNTGRIVRARALATDEPVRILQLKQELLSSSEAWSQLEREVDAVMKARHPNVLRVHGLETADTGTFLVMEWTDGFSLMELLRTRREIHAVEALLLLEQAAAGVDYAIKQGLRRIDFSLHQILLHFPDGAPDRDELLRKNLAEWPRFELKLNPLGIAQELSLSDTWAGAQTIAGNITNVPRESATVNLPAKYVQSLAAITFELLGGTLSPLMLARSSTQPAPRYVPLASLPEAGNEVLKRALDPQRSFLTAREFYEALRELDGLDARKHETLHGTRAGAPIARRAPAAEVPARAQTPLPVPPAIRTPARSTAPAPEVPEHARHAPVSPKLVFAMATGLLALLLAGAAAMFLLRKPPAPQPVQSTTAATTTTPAPATPTPAPIVTATPAPLITPKPMPITPDQKDLLAAAVRETEAAEGRQDWAGAITGYLRIARDFPQSETGRVRLDVLFEKIRNNPRSLSPFEFESLRESIVAAAKLDVVAAMMLLGDYLRREEPKAAFDWFCAAAGRGHPQAFTQVGLMYSNGLGVARDLDQAVWWFREAGERGDAAGLTCLAECYLYGKGVQKDEQEGVRILKDAVSHGDARAMNLLGTCFHRGTGAAADYKEAMRLFSRSYELGYNDALGNLGVLYMNGDGVARDPKRAVDLFLTGAKKGNAYCMYLYAKCLETGSGTEPNRGQAESWYRKSADGGNLRAVEWLRKNHLAPGRAAAER